MSRKEVKPKMRWYYFHDPIEIFLAAVLIIGVGMIVVWGAVLIYAYLWRL